MNYDDMSTSELRKLVRDKGMASGLIVAGARKADLIALLKGDITELPNGLPNGASTSAAAASGELIDIIASALSGRINSGIDEEQVIELVQPMIDKAISGRPEPKQIVINGIQKPEIDEHTHQCFERCVRLVASGLPVLLVGPAGTGKTTLARQVAKALGRSFTFNSMSAGVTEGQLVGRVIPDASGAFTFVHAPFAKTYRDGGVHLFDEIDAADANLMTFLNAAISNGHLSIPQNGEVIERHPETAIICAANTYGTGATRQYVGRNQLDAATLDRFAVSTVTVGYDTVLEKKIAECILGEKASTVLEPCWKIRASIESNSLRRIMSTRTITNLSAIVKAGGSIFETLEESYFSGWTEDEKRRVQQA